MIHKKINYVNNIKDKAYANVQQEIMSFLEATDARSPESSVKLFDLKPYADDPWEIIGACLRLLYEKKLVFSLDGIYLYCEQSAGYDV